MPSYQKQIADALVTSLAAVSGATATVEYRKADVVTPRDAYPLTLVTPGFQRPAGRAFEQVIHKEYGFQVSIYRETSGDLTAGIDTNPTYIQAAKQACDVASLTGAPVVWDVDLVDDPDAWERQEFVKGVEVSRFGLLVRTTEPQNG